MDLSTDAGVYTALGDLDAELRACNARNGYPEPDELTLKPGIKTQK